MVITVRASFPYHYLGTRPDITVARICTANRPDLSDHTGFT